MKKNLNNITSNIDRKCNNEIINQSILIVMYGLGVENIMVYANKRGYKYIGKIKNTSELFELFSQEFGNILYSKYHILYSIGENLDNQLKNL